jgi:hypothetical protein
MQEGQGTEEGMDLHQAADIMREARRHAERELQFSHPVMLAGGGVIYVLAYTTAPWAVRLRARSSSCWPA